jgi:hypothetical protein
MDRSAGDRIRKKGSLEDYDMVEEIAKDHRIY